MEQIKRTVVFVSLFSIAFSCKFLSSGYTNEYNQFVPKREKFQLKKENGGRSIPQLDTVNIYRLVEKYYGNDRLFPNEHLSETDYTKKLFQQAKMYIMFYSNGRCLSFSIWSKDSLGNENSLKEQDMNPNSAHYGKDYYYGNTPNSLLIESFVYAEGDGRYLTFEYFINKDGDTIKMMDGKDLDIYVKELLPKDWKRYPVDW